ncbi:MAG TPA: hypothetical protein VMG12_09910, partial [Polyangiaceae bacterium]|nr:hypothetical protein [Polyangiaceae bacterium]
MRFVSLSFCTVWALGCGDGDQSTIDPNYRNGGARAGNGEAALPGANGTAGDGDGSAEADAPPMTKPPEPSACDDPAVGIGACAGAGTGSNAASSDGELPGPDGNGSSSDGSGAEGDSSSGDEGAGSAEPSGGESSGGESSGGAGGAASGGSGAASGAGASGGDGAGGTGGEPEPLPDLVLDGAYLMATIQQDFVEASADQCLFNEGCVTGDGRRRVVRFGTRSANVGSADVIVGKPVAGNPLWEFDACHE